MANRALTANEIETQLEDLLDAALSPRRGTSPLVAALALLPRIQQDLVLHWTEVMAKTNAELAYHFVARAKNGLQRMDSMDVEAWVIQAMDVYDKLGLHPACNALDDVEAFADAARVRARTVAFEDVAGILTLFVQGLSGRRLQVQAGDETYTDTATLFLPARESGFATRDANFRLYKATVAHLWAQTWYGTFRVNLAEVIARYADPDQALRLFHALETIRLEARIAHELPGLHRDLQALRAVAGSTAYPAAWRSWHQRLERIDATVDDTCAALEDLYGTEAPPDLPYQGLLRVDRAQATMTARQVKEKAQLQDALARLLNAQGTNQQPSESRSRRFSIDKASDPAHSDRSSFELNLDGKRVDAPNETQTLMQSIVQDIGTVPDDYLIAAADGRNRPESTARKADPIDPEIEEGARLYNEWDYRRQHYRKDWCALREIEVTPTDEPFVQRTLQKYAGLAATLRKTFEALRGDDKVQKRQKHGDDIDLDALIEARADLHSGRELNERLFMRTHKIERNIAVMFMVDMSGSTKGWINEAERESLVLLCEALEVLGDRYAIYGFSGITRKRCELYRVKRFDEPYSEPVRQRITGMQPQDYTRMGVAIRHLTHLLDAVDARTKLLITLSDGKPDDYDGYRGDYGIEDTRQALLEAKRARIHPFCITIDTQARDYLPHMYGAANYTLIDDVRKLPFRVSDVYRRLTA
jgi:nitric oxide reductase NorD protein